MDSVRMVPEILAPAGSPDALHAAVQNGADAVYLGLTTMNARRGAENFDLDALSDACRYAHLRDVRIYLTANILTLPEEIHGALQLVDEAWTRGVDAVIVQDLGLLDLLRREMPEVRVHASTQIDAHNSETASALAGLGVSRITLARETRLEDVARIVESSTVEVETFVHGALCFSYSGQCLLSSMIGGRSANRGLCAQPCRLAYELVDETGERAEVPGRYLLSPRDLAAIELLPQLVKAGVSALKIEGRMKSPEYVALVVGVYRAALDRALADPESYVVSKAEWETLEEAFSRGFTKGLLGGVRDNEMMSYMRPNNRGVPVGRVTAVEEGRATVALDRGIDSDDTLEFWTGRGRFAQQAGEMRTSAGPVREAPAGQKVTLSVERALSPGDRVFRVANASLLSAARRTFAGQAERRPVPVEIGVDVEVGKPLRVTLRARGKEGPGLGPVVEEARTKPVTAAEVMEHVGRLGGTAYAPESWDLRIDPRSGLGFSVLHAARREAAEALESELFAPWAGRRPAHPPVPSLSERRRRHEAAGLDVVVISEEVGRACLEAGAERAFLLVGANETARELPSGIVPFLPRVAHEDETAALLRWASPGRPLLCGNLGLLAAANERGARVEADWSLNIVNPFAAEELASVGATFAWASPELSERQLAELASRSPLPVGIAAYGRVELMVAEHCVLQAIGACAQRCATCARRKGRWLLRDQKGYEFPVRTDLEGRAHVYNSVTLDLSRVLNEVLATGVARLRLELRLEGPEEAATVTRAFRSRMEAASAGREEPAEPIVQPATSGHFFRGVR